MPPLLATIFCSVFVAWLVFRDIRTRQTVSTAIWIPCLWAFILGSRPISAWPIAASFGLSSSMTTTADYVEGSPFDRLVFLALIALGCVVIKTRKTDFRSLGRLNKWLLVYFAYLAASALWSDYSFVSFKRWVKDF